MNSPSRFLWLALLWILAGCATTSGDGSFALGREEFLPGDSIKILHVARAPTASGSGVTVIVQGTYVLRSQPSAMLSLNLTTTNRGSRSRAQPLQRINVTQGTGEFELALDVTDPGDLHVSYYPSGGGNSFGGVYFDPAGR